MGGPVDIPKIYNGKDKTFFFFTYEGLRQPQMNTYHLGSPPQAIRDGDFSNYIPFGQTSIFKIYDPLTNSPQSCDGDIHSRSIPWQCHPPESNFECG